MRPLRGPPGKEVVIQSRNCFNHTCRPSNKLLRSQNILNCLRRSQLELHGPRNGLSICPRKSRR
eukprot:4648576-Alexandrium_andersonii.AAC.1